MPYNRVSAMGVEHGQINPAEQDAARRAQMQMLMSGGGRAPGPWGGETAPEPMAPQGSQILNNVGRPAYETDYMSRMNKADMDMQGLKGTQEMDLQKQKGADYNQAVTTQMAPAMGANQRAQTEFDEGEAIRGFKRQAQRNFLEGNGGSDDDLIRGSIAMGMDPAGLVAARGQERSYARQDEQAQEAARNALIAELSKTNPEVASQLAGGSKTFQGIDQGLLSQGFNTASQKDFGTVSANPQVPERIKKLIEVIDNNDLYFTQGNLSELNKAYDELNGLLAQLRASPEAKAQILQQARDKMREAITRNTSLFQGAGMGKIEDAYLK